METKGIGSKEMVYKIKIKIFTNLQLSRSHAKLYFIGSSPLNFMFTDFPFTSAASTDSEKVLKFENFVLIVKTLISICYKHSLSMWCS